MSWCAPPPLCPSRARSFALYVRDVYSAPAEQLGTSIVVGWSRSSPLKKPPEAKPPDLFGPSKPSSAWADPTPHGEIAFHPTVGDTAILFTPPPRTRLVFVEPCIDCN